MVLTGPVNKPSPARPAMGGPSRRAVLRAVLGVGATGFPAALAAGCGLFDRKDADRASASEPLASVRDAALALSGLHREVMTAYPALAARLLPLADAHTAHASELARHLSGTARRAATPTAEAIATPPAKDADAALAALRTAEQEGQRAAAAVCLKAPAAHAALVASICAARACHVEALR